MPLIVEMLEKNTQPQMERELVRLYLKMEKDPKSHCTDVGPIA